MAWAASKKCLPQMNVCAARVAALNLDGSHIIGANNSYATNATVLIGITPVYDPGAEIKEKDGCGTTFVDVIAAPTLVRYDIDIDFWSTDPNLLTLIIPQGLVLTGAAGEVGFGYPSPGVVSGQFSFEFWQKIINANKVDPDYPYAHWALPYLNNVAIQKRDVDGTKVSHTVLKAEAFPNANWFSGPGDDFVVPTTQPVFYVPSATLPTMNCTPVAITS